MTAYVDESLRLGGDGLYVLAAVVVPPSRAPDVRDALHAGLRRGQRRWHWRDESAAGRVAMARAVGALGLRSVVVVVGGVDPRRQERARRRCLTALLWELDQRRVEQVVFESRQHRDAEDRQMIAFALRSGWVEPTMRYDFAGPFDECLLWLADAVAGACAEALSGGDPAYLATLGDSVDVVEVPPRCTPCPPGPTPEPGAFPTPGST